MSRTVCDGWRSGGRTLPLIVMLVALGAAVAGCGQTVPGTAHAEGEGPSAAGSSTESPAGSSAAEPTGSVRAAPPTEFREPSGRPTVTVQPDPLLPASPTSEPVVPRPLPGSGGPATTTPLAAPQTDGGSSAPRTRRPAAVPDRAAAPGGNAAPVVAAAPLTADVVADECLLDAAAFAALLGGPVGTPAENEVTRSDGSRTRSCYATARSGSATAAVNVYRVNSGTPAAFVRAAVGGRQLPGIGDGAVLLETVGGSALQVATPTYLVTVGVVDDTPTDDRWSDAGRAVAAAAGRR